MAPDWAADGSSLHGSPTVHQECLLGGGFAARCEHSCNDGETNLRHDFAKTGELWLDFRERSEDFPPNRHVHETDAFTETGRVLSLIDLRK